MSSFLTSYLKRIAYYKLLGEQTFAQLDELDFHYQPNEESNSIAIIIQHIAGNMLSRFTDFLNSDGEKEWRNRDTEFEEKHLSKEELMALWQKGWNCYLTAVQSLTGNDLEKTITIRSEQLTVTDALNRQLAHYPYHVGQIVYLGRLIKNKTWKNLSIPKGQSQQFNDQMKK
ncbi:MAG: DUF1572 domain-containing protein [Chitinophagaceae bacterium]|nr:DUF1572 domain-containing protein [Chitinophagaceae bacterium]